MGNARLRITDGTEKVDLLDGIDGFWLVEWVPMATPEREAIWSQSAYSAGRRPVFQTYDNTIDSFAFNARKENQDQAIASLRKLRRLLIKANRYWVDAQQFSPVWVEARGDCETEIRYAHIVDHRMLEDRNPHSMPFSDKGTAVLDGIPLVVEHIGWRSQSPGVGGCIKASTVSQYYGEGDAATVTSQPAQQEDDAYQVLSDPTAYNFVSDNLPIGSLAAIGGSTLVGIRFPNIAVAQGKTILNAYILVDAYGIDDGDPAKCKIYGYDGSMSTFADRADFMEKFKDCLPDFIEYTSSQESWVAGQQYIIQGLAPIIQAIVDQAAWVSGDDMGIFFIDNGSATGTGYKLISSFDDVIPLRDPPQLVIEYLATGRDFGQEATCLDQVFLSNKQVMANITHAYIYDASLAAFSANLAISAGLFDLLTNPVANGDILYLGSDSTLPESGPFDNLIFDVVTAAIYTGAAYSVWEYWDGAAWSALDVSDTTTAGVGAFSDLGVGSVHWIPPADWATTAINAKTAWWVRLRIVIPVPPGDSISTPEHQNRAIYSAVLAGALVGDDQLLGDLRAAARIALHVRSAGDADGEPTEPLGHLNSMYIATRPVRGNGLFTPYLNCGAQNPEGMIFADYPDDGEAAVASRVVSPTGVALQLNPTLSPQTELLIGTFQLEGDLALEYYGKFRVFARVFQDGGVDGDFTLYLDVRSGSTATTRRLGGVSPTADVDFQLLDYGVLTLPNNLVAGTELADLLLINLVADVADDAGDLWVYDLILFPLDDWGGEFATIDETEQATYVGVDQTLNVDSFGNPKAARRAYVTNQSGSISAWYKTRCTTPLSLPTSEHRIWVHMRRYLSGDWQSPPHLCVSLQLTGQYLYKSMRGDT